MGASFSISEFLDVALKSSGISRRSKETKLFKYIKMKRWDEAMVRAAKKPTEVSTWLTIGFPDGRQISILPIHVAVSMNPPVAMVETLIKAWPKCLTAKETLFGRLPLHLACTVRACVCVF